MLPLGIVPIFFGFFLQSVSARSMLRYSTLLLAATSLLFLFVDSFWQLLVLRAIQGLLLPAIFTSLMTYCSAIAPDNRVRQYIAYYIATTVFGGFFGRAFSGAVATVSDWRYSFGVLAVLLLIGWAAQRQLDSDAKSNYVRPSISLLVDVWKQPGLRFAFLTIFSFFFTYSALLNALPFRMVEVTPTISEFGISSVYFGYLIGIVVATNSEKITALFGGQSAAFIKLFIIYTLSLWLFSIPESQWMVGFNLLASACFFLLHASLSGQVNQHANGNNGIVNGLYVSFYYAGGSLGAWLPAFIYRDFGWSWFTAGLCAVLAFSFWCSRRIG